MRPFLEEMELHLMVRRLRQMGAESLDDWTPHYTRMRLQHSPPFGRCPSGFIRDLHEYAVEGPLVPCPRIEPLLESLTVILIDYGTSFVETVGPRRKSRELEQATRTIRRALESWYPERRHKKLWRDYQALMKALEQKSGDDYRRLEPHRQALLSTWRHGLARLMRQAFETFGPPQATYPREAVYIAIASIYYDLSLERGQWRSLADRIRKRCGAREALA
jgi:hypothetical protein